MNTRSNFSHYLQSLPLMNSHHSSLPSRSLGASRRRGRICIITLSVLAQSSTLWAQATPEPPKGTNSQTPAQPQLKKEAPASSSPGAEVHDQFAALLGRPGGLTSDEAARKAASYSLDAKVAQEDYKSAEALVTKTVYDYMPKLTVTASYTRQSIPDSTLDYGSGNLVATPEPAGPLAPGAPLAAIDGEAFNFNPLPNQYYLNAGLVVPISDYLLNMSSAFAGANALKNRAEYLEKAERLNAAANGRLSYYQWVRARLKMAEAESSIRRAQAQLDDLKALAAGGRVSRADVLRQDAFLASTELNFRRASTAEAIAKERLHTLMLGSKGVTPDWEIGEDVLEDRPEDNKPLPAIEELHRQAVANRLEILALAETEHGLEEQSSFEKTQGYPRVEGFGNLTYANPNPVYVPPTNAWNTSWNLGIRLVWTVNDLGSAHHQAQSTQAEVAKVRAQKQGIQDALRTEVLSARRSIEEARLARESARRGEKAAQASFVDRSLLFENGRATSLDVLQAESALLTARTDLVDAYIALRLAQVRLNHAVGWDVPPSYKQE